MPFAQELDKQRIEQPVQPLEIAGHVWLYCPPEKSDERGYWHNTSGKRAVRVYEPYASPPALGVWRVLLINGPGEEKYFAFDGPCGKLKAFQFAASYVRLG
jgi:hypothetical protein